MKNMVGKMKNSTEGLEDKIEKFSQGKKNQRQEMETREKIKQKNQTRTSNSWKKKKGIPEKKIMQENVLDVRYPHIKSSYQVPYTMNDERFLSGISSKVH